MSMLFSEVWRDLGLLVAASLALLLGSSLRDLSCGFFENHDMLTPFDEFLVISSVLLHLLDPEEVRCSALFDFGDSLPSTLPSDTDPDLVLPFTPEISMSFLRNFTEISLTVEHGLKVVFRPQHVL